MHAETVLSVLLQRYNLISPTVVHKFIFYNASTTLFSTVFYYLSFPFS